MADLIPLVIVGLLLWRLEPLASRLMAVVEKRTAMLEDTLHKGIPAKAPIPADLYTAAMDQSEPWARDQYLEHLNELYDTLGDWQRVRTAVMSGNEPDGD